MDTAPVNFNLASRGTDLQKDVLFADFNQDCTSITLATKSGYSIYALDSIENVKLAYDNNGNDTEICMLDRCLSRGLVAFSSLKSPKKLKVCNFMNGMEMCDLSYPNSILALKINRSRLIVVLENSISIRSMVDMITLHTISDTPSNPKGLCCLSCNKENPYFAYPGSSVAGEIQLFDVFTLSKIRIIKTHDSPLAAMNFDSTAKMIATASNKGTVI